jgi:uncharacterized glyoxalase superfamily protein PhnB
LTVKDAKRSIDFYERAFGFTVEGKPLESGGKITHVSMKFEQAAIMFSPEGSWDSTCKAPRSIGVKPAINLYVYCPDVDAVHAQAVKAGDVPARRPGWVYLEFRHQRRRFRSDQDAG